MRLRTSITKVKSTGCYTVRAKDLDTNESVTFYDVDGIHEARWRRKQAICLLYDGTDLPYTDGAQWASFLTGEGVNSNIDWTAYLCGQAPKIQYAEIDGEPLNTRLMSRINAAAVKKNRPATVRLNDGRERRLFSCGATPEQFKMYSAYVAGVAYFRGCEVIGLEIEQGLVLIYYLD